jgi:AAA+ ATPase superfamily predicted ATPase
MKNIIGREDDIKALNVFLRSNKSEFLAVYGRRRIGKTFLITNFFTQTDCVFFYVSGIQKYGLEEQIKEFVSRLSQTFYAGATLASFKKWLDAFDELTKAINKIPSNKKVVLFFDEFPWMVTKKSKLLQALDYYWNRFWVHDSRLKLIICGSAASWIIRNIINNKGGLYNRVTKIMFLEPFTLAQTRNFIKASGVNLNNKQILNLYMVFGGVPFYLTLIEKGLSSEQNIDKLCFRLKGALFAEFDNLFTSLFSQASVYKNIIKILAKHRYGLGQKQLIKACKLSDGGRTIRRFQELENAGFITSFLPHNHQEKGIYYKVIDEFILFYLYWIEPNITTIKRLGKISGYWHAKVNSPLWANWAGYAFEAICYKHITNIREALQINVGAEIGSWRYVPRSDQQKRGAQIDLLFDRSDDSVTVCEIKYSKEPFVIDKQYAASLMNKVAVYKKQTETKKQIFIAMISSNGLKPTMYAEELISNCVTLDDLFK